MFIKHPFVRVVNQKGKIVDSIFVPWKEDMPIARSAEIIIHVMYTATAIILVNAI